MIRCMWITKEHSITFTVTFDKNNAQRINLHDYLCLFMSYITLRQVRVVRQLFEISGYATYLAIGI